MESYLRRASSGLCPRELPGSFHCKVGRSERGSNALVLRIDGYHERHPLAAPAVNDVGKHRDEGFTDRFRPSYGPRYHQVPPSVPDPFQV